MKLILIRHGQTTTNDRGTMHFQNDPVGLDAIGRRQIHETAKVCRIHAVEYLICSPERRAIESCELIAGKLGINYEVSPLIGERNWGDFNGRPWSEVKDVLDKLTLAERYSYIPPGGGESWQQVEVRLTQFLHDLTQSPDKIIGVVTHGGTLRALMPIIKHEPKETSFQYDFLNASVTIVDDDKIILENNIQHLI